jgi:tetratricopeptide (TPR) repeat protein
MTFREALIRAVLLLPMLGMGACATTATAPPPIAEDQELRDTDLDVLFATEFPVESKYEATQRAGDAWSKGDLDRALFFYVKALQFEPDDTDLLAIIGMIHSAQNNPRMAVRAYTRALNIDPLHVASLEKRGLLLLAHDEDERAAADLQKAVALNPALWRAQNGLGVLADKKGDHETAITYYRGYSRYLLGDFELARTDLLKAATELGYEQAWVNLGVVYAAEGDYADAVEVFKNVLSQSESCNRAAEAAIANGDYAVAERLLERAISESPRYYPAAEENLAALRLRDHS